MAAAGAAAGGFPHFALSFRLGCCPLLPPPSAHVSVRAVFRDMQQLNLSAGTSPTGGIPVCARVPAPHIPAPSPPSGHMAPVALFEPANSMQGLKSAFSEPIVERASDWGLAARLAGSLLQRFQPPKPLESQHD